MDANSSLGLDTYLADFSQEMSIIGSIWPGDHLAVAVSGGVDSLALVHLLHLWVKQQTIPLGLIALTVDHQLRSEACEEAEQVGVWLAKYDIDHQILTWQRPNNVGVSGNIQAQARQARYDLLLSFCQANTISHLFLGHHQQDQQETVVQRMSRGTGMVGLSAMSRVSWRQQIRLCRPILTWRKQRLATFLSLFQQPWIEDPSNHNHSYDRVKWRYVMPMLEHQGLTTKRVVQLADHARRAQDSIDRQKQRRLGQIARGFGWGGVWISPDFGQNLDDEIDLRCLSDILTHVGGGIFGLRFHSLEQILIKCRAILQSDITTNNAYTIHGCFIKSFKKGLLCLREAGAISPERYPYPSYPTSWRWDRRFRLFSVSGFLRQKDLMVGQYDPTVQISASLKDHMVEDYQIFPRQILRTLPILYHGGQLSGYPDPDGCHFIFDNKRGQGIEKEFGLSYDPQHKLGS